MSELRDRLRALPTFPDDLPKFDIAAAPDDPMELLLIWLDDAIASGARQPTAFALTTIDDHGLPASRTLIVKDIDEHGIRFSSSKSSRKGQHLSTRPGANMLFFWRESGRQVEILGDVRACDDEAEADWRERHNFSGTPNPDWQVWSLQPTRFEFLQATHDRNHTRLEYLRDKGQWRRSQLKPSESTSS